MGTLHIVSKAASAEALDAMVMGSRQRPLATITDFSVMALRVDRLDESARVLKEENYSVSRGAFGLAVVFKGRQRLGHLINALARNNIFAEMTDIADSMYQG